MEKLFNPESLYWWIGMDNISKDGYPFGFYLLCTAVFIVYKIIHIAKNIDDYRNGVKDNSLTWAIFEIILSPVFMAGLAPIIAVLLVLGIIIGTPWLIAKGISKLIS